MRWFGSRTVLVCALAAMIGSNMSASALACGTIVRVTFVEASPDHFLIEHLKGHRGHLRSVAIDLSPSVGNAFVDTRYGAAMSEAGNMVELDSIAGFSTGTQSGSINFKAFSSGNQFEFLVDLDDRAAGGDFDMNVLTANELEGGTVSVLIGDPAGGVLEWTGVFDANGIAHVGNRACA